MKSPPTIPRTALLVWALLGLGACVAAGEAALRNGQPTGPDHATRATPPAGGADKAPAPDRSAHPDARDTQSRPDAPHRSDEPSRPAAPDLAGRPGAEQPAPRDEAPAPRNVRVIILHVNDTHGRLLTHRHRGQPTGGYARLATVVADARRDTGDANRVLLIHAGDVLSRGDRLTRATLGAANVRLMNHLRFDAWTPGNGEFYDGLDVLSARIDEANFPVLTTNVRRAETGRPLGTLRAVRPAGGPRIGLIGLCTVYARNRDGLTVDGAVAAASMHAPALRSDANADAVVAVSHLGLPADLLLAQVAPGLDVIIGGHTHSRLAKGRHVTGPDDRKVLIAHAGQYLRTVGRVELTFRREGDRYTLIDRSAGLVPLDSRVRLDPTVKARLAEMYDRLDHPARQPTR